MDNETFALIESALHDHGFVVIPGQTLSAEQFVAFSRRFGNPEPHVIDRFHHPADPNIRGLQRPLNCETTMPLAKALAVGRKRRRRGKLLR